MIDVGTGPPLVIIPGIQGRWEWMRPAVRALGASRRVITFSLSEIVDGIPDPDSFFDRGGAFLDRLLDRAGLEAAAFVGVSFGGLLAARYAAHRPNRVSALVLVSTPAPRWALDARRAKYLRRPLRSAPLFAIGGLHRLLPEVIASQPNWWQRAAVLLPHLSRIVRFPASPRRMAAWGRAWQTAEHGIGGDRISAPTLVVTGESHLDRVVPQDITLEYMTLIPGARHAVLPRTGHIGLVTRPQAFAELVGRFLCSCS